jgi:hypothetical protein
MYGSEIPCRERIWIRAVVVQYGLLVAFSSSAKHIERNLEARAPGQDIEFRPTDTP